MVLYAREEDPHGVRPVVQVRDAGPVQVAGQLIDVRLQLSEGWKRGRTKEMRDRLEGILARHASVKSKNSSLIHREQIRESVSSSWCLLPL